MAKFVSKLLNDLIFCWDCVLVHQNGDSQMYCIEIVSFINFKVTIRKGVPT